ncbi:MAG: hypothetical protein KHY44_14910 [Clostridiales bacterium]|jgi:hypothetical protein|nr:hypothetical protein [Clostridiales bacterium]
MANSHVLDEKGYGMCRCCRRKFFISDLKLCVYCDRWVCKNCATKEKGFEDAYTCKVCKRGK